MKTKCPHCKKMATFTAHYTKMIEVVAPAYFDKDSEEWIIDYDKEAFEDSEYTPEEDNVYYCGNCGESY